MLIEGGGNTIVYEQDAALREARLRAVLDQPLARVAARQRCASCSAACRRSRCPTRLGYDNVFRVLIVQFIDAYNFDVRSVKKTCVHIVHPDGRLIPFDTYNLFYRDGLEASSEAAHGGPLGRARPPAAPHRPRRDRVR